MHRRHFIFCAPLALAACSGRWTTDYSTQLTADITRGWTIREVNVAVPAQLSVSEKNSLAPNANIVWHGDPEGDRRKQVAAIIEEGILRGTSDLSGPRRVSLSITLQDFHAVTPAAVSRAPSAVHKISYVVQVFDARTLQPVTQPTQIHADLVAYTQAAAVVASQEGQTQKVRITDHIERVTRGWLGIGPDVRGGFSGIGR